MKVWLIEPHEPLIFREGKPFEATPGAHARSLPFPFPSTTAGALRSQSHLNESGVFGLPEGKTADDLKKISVRGPLLVSLKPDSDAIEQWFVPAPADALLLNVKEKSEQEEEGKAKDEESEKQAIVRQLAPLTIKSSEDYTDFTIERSDEQEALQIVGLPWDEAGSDLEKPYKNAPRYWYWERFKHWLSTPPPSTPQTVAELGISGPTYERRVHVAMDHSTRAGKEGKLFDTSGLEFTHIKASSKKETGSPLYRAQRLSLALVTDDERDNDEQNKADRQFVEITNKLGTLGGERRLVSWRESNVELPPCPKELKEQIIAEKRCRLFLLTPAYFSEGYRPTWLRQPHEQSGVQLKLKAIAIQRPQVVSGWDMAAKRARPSRRLAPNGTVLFLELEGEDKAIEEWIEKIWFSCVSDNIQYRRDGFGLAVLGAWPTGPDSAKGGQA